jgi:hypothetical protein
MALVRVVPLFRLPESANEGASGGGAINMVKRGISFIASVALIALSGCATHSQSYGVAQSTESDVRPSALPSDLVGTWHVLYAPVGSDASGGNAFGSATLVIKDDGTYTAIDRRKGSTRTFSGVVVANGRTITLRTSTGRWVSLMRRGGMLYGVAPDQVSGHRIQISAEEDTGVLASPPSEQSGQ